MDESVPIIDAFTDVYTDDAQASQQTRWDNLLASFRKEYDGDADIIARSPGRVNIIGEVASLSIEVHIEVIIDLSK